MKLVSSIQTGAQLSFDAVDNTTDITTLDKLGVESFVRLTALLPAFPQLHPPFCFFGWLRGWQQWGFLPHFDAGDSIQR